MNDETSRDADELQRPGVRPLAEAAVDDDLIWALVDAAPDALVVIDDVGTIALVNGQTEALFGYRRGDLLGRPVEVLVPESVRSVHRAHRTRYRADPAPRPMGEGESLRGRTIDGSDFPVEISLSPVTSNGRQWIIAAVRDVSNRLEAERSSRAIRHAIDTAVDGILIVDDGTMQFTYVNNQAAAMHGYTVEEMIGMTPLHLAPQLNEERLARALAPLISGDSSGVTLETMALRKDGTTFPTEVHVNRPPGADDEAGRPFVAVVRDITDRVNAAQELVDQRAQARILADRERLARDLHDRVIGDLLGLGMGLQATVGRIADVTAAARIQGAVTGLDDVIRLLRATIFGLSSAADSAGSARMEIQEHVSALQDRLGHEPNLTLNGPIDELPGQLLDEITAVVHEALTNIAKHARAAATDITIDAVGERLTVTIADDGAGLPDDRPSTTGGLGLANLHTRARRLGGQCTMRPGPTSGLTLVWTVPIGS